MRVLAAAVLLTLPSVARAECRAIGVAAQGRLVLKDGQTSRLLVTDSAGTFRPRFSRDGSRVAYHTAFRGGEARVRIAEVESGRIQAEIRVAQADHSVNAIHQLGWRASGEVWLEGHVNPYTSIYLAFDGHSGAFRRSIPGLGFSVSPDGTRLAHFSHVPHFTPQDRRPARVLVLDDRELVEIAGDFRGPIVWSADGTVLTFRKEADGAASLVQVNLETGLVRTLDFPVQRIVTRERGVTSDTWCSSE
jgi:hypothetical protein